MIASVDVVRNLGEPACLPGGSLVGRRSEYQRLRALIELAARGEGRICMVTGPAGIGKTRLVEEVLTTAGDHGFQVLYGGGAELEHRRPFGAIADCLGIRASATDERRSRIAELLVGTVHRDSGIPAEAATTEFRVLEATLALVEELCASGPVAMAVDDLQWADPSTVLFLHRLGRYVRELPAVVICCWRPVPRRPELDRLAENLATAGEDGIVLGPLTQSETVEMLRSAIGGKPGPNLQQMASDAGGNPLFLSELTAALRRDGTLVQTEPGYLDVSSGSLPPSLSLAILHRLSYLSEEALALLQTAAVVGSRLEVADVCLLLGRSATSLMATFREVIDAGILDDDGTRLVFRHDLIREALYQDLPAPVRSAMHRDAARALAEAGAPTERVAEHAARGATLGDSFAIEWIHRAAVEVASRAPGVAIDWLDQALQLASADDPRRDELAADRAVSLLWSGRVGEAEAACRDLLTRRHHPSIRFSVLLCLAQALFARGRGEDAVRIAEQAAADPVLSANQRAQVSAWVSLGHIGLGRMHQATQAAQAALAESPADDIARSLALTTLATVTNFRGHFREAVQQQTLALTVAHDADRSAHRVPLNFYHAMFLVEIDELDRALGALSIGRQVSEEIGARWNLPLYAWATAWVRFVAGRWDDALAECEASLALADELGTRHGIVLVHSLRAMIALHRGGLEHAAQAVRAAEDEFTATGPQHGLENLMIWARALLAEANGELSGAVAGLSDAWDALLGAGISSYRADLGPDLVRIAAAAGDLDRADAATAAVEDLVPLNPGLPRTTGAAQHCRGLVTGNPGLLVEAAASLERSARPFDTARAFEDAATALDRAGDRVSARHHYDRALRLFDGLEAGRAIARTEARLRAVGFRRGSRSSRNRPTTGWASLTATERTIADLVANGMTNPQIAQRLFISRHTVHTHVSHVLAKLQVASRVELAAEAALRRAESLRQDPQQVQPANEHHRRSAVDGHPT